MPNPMVNRLGASLGLAGTGKLFDKHATKVQCSNISMYMNLYASDA